MVVNGATKLAISTISSALPREVVVDHMKEQALLALQGPRAAEVLERSSRASASSSSCKAAPFQCARAQRVDQPLGLYRRGRVRDFDAGSAAAELADALVAQRAGEADRPGRARFAAARGRAAALRPRSRPRDDAGDGRAHFRDQQAPPRRRRLCRRDADPRGARRTARRRSASASTSRAASRCARARWCSTAKAMKSAGSPAAASRPRCSGRSRWAMSRATLAEPGTALKLEQRGKLFDARVAAMPFVPHRYHRKGAA